MPLLDYPWQAYYDKRRRDVGSAPQTPQPVAPQPVEAAPVTPPAVEAAPPAVPHPLAERYQQKLATRPDPQNNFEDYEYHQGVAEAMETVDPAWGVMSDEALLRMGRERIARKKEETGFFETATKSVAGGTAQFLAGVAGLGQTHIDSDWAAQQRKELLASAQGFAPPEEIMAGTFWENPSIDRATHIVGSAAPSMAVSYAPAVVGGLLLGPPGAKAGAALGSGFQGWIQGNETYMAAREAGTPKEKALALAVLSGASTTASEYIPIGRVLGARGLVRGVVSGLIEEGGTEVFDQVAQNVIQKYGWDLIHELDEGLIESFIGGGVLGAGTGGVAGHRNQRDFNRVQAQALRMGMTPEEFEGVYKRAEGLHARWAADTNQRLLEVIGDPANLDTPELVAQNYDGILARYNQARGSLAQELEAAPTENAKVLAKARLELLDRNMETIFSDYLVTPEQTAQARVAQGEPATQVAQEMPEAADAAYRAKIAQMAARPLTPPASPAGTGPTQRPPEQPGSSEPSAGGGGWQQRTENEWFLGRPEAPDARVFQLPNGQFGYDRRSGEGYAGSDETFKTMEEAAAVASGPRAPGWRKDPQYDEWAIGDEKSPDAKIFRTPEGKFIYDFRTENDYAQVARSLDTFEEARAAAGDSFRAAHGRALELGQEGRDAPIHLPNQKDPVPAKWAVVEASSLKPSHNAFTFAPTPGYPEGVQERQYDQDREEQAKVVAHGLGLKPDLVLAPTPDLVNGPPAVTDQGLVLGGNSRVMSIQRAYREGRGQQYREALAARAAEYGVPPETIQGMQEPVLVRRVEQAPREPQAMHRMMTAMNMAPTQAMGRAAKVASMGANVSPRTVERVGARLASRNQSVREMLSDTSKDGPAAEVLDMLVEDGVIAPQERAQYFDDETREMTPDGKALVERTLLGAAVRDSKVLTRAYRKGRGMLQRLERGLVGLTKLQSAKGWEIDVGRAMELALDAKESNEGRIDEYLKQASIADPKDYSPGEIGLAKALTRMTPTEFGRAMNGYAADAVSATSDQASMLKAPERQESFQEWFGEHWTDDVAMMVGPGNLPPLRPKAAVLQEEFDALPLTNAPRIRVVQWLDELPEDIFLGMQTGAMARGVDMNRVKVKGLFIKKREEIYLIADNLADKPEAFKTLLHELAHYAGPKVLGEQYEQFMEELFALKEAEIRKINALYQYNLETRPGRINAADEWFARQMGEGTLEDSLWQRFLRVIRRFVRSLGVDVRLSDAEVVGLAEDMRRFLSGRGRPDVGMVLSGSDVAMMMEGENDLVAVHTLRANNLARADQLGGFPMPSIAIMKDQDAKNFQDFGEITLVGDADMVDPAKPGNVVYSRDFHSPMLPDPLPTRYDFSSKEIRVFFEMFRDDVRTERPADSLSIGARLVDVWNQYLADNYVNSDPHAFDAFARSTGFATEDDRALYDAAMVAYLRERHGYTRDMVQTGEGLSGEDRWRVPASGVNREDDFRDNLLRFMRRPRESAAFRQWSLEKLSQIRKAPPNREIRFGRQWVPATPEAYVDYMAQGMPDQMVPGEDSRPILAKVARPLESLQAIRSEKNRLDRLSSPAVQAAQEKLEETLERLSSDHGVDDDVLEPVILRLARQWYQTNEAPDDASVQEALGAELNYDPGELESAADLVDAVREYVRVLVEFPTDMFEAKPQRVVNWEDWKAAIVPDNAAQETIQILEKRGLPVFKRSEAENAFTGVRFAVRDVADQTLGEELTLDDIRKVFPGQEVGYDPDGSVWVRTQGKQGLKIERVQSIAADEIAFKASYGRMMAPGEMAVGKYESGTITLAMVGDRWTLRHETTHWLEDAGILNPMDVAVIKAHIKQLAKEGKFTVDPNRELGGAEDRADWIATAIEQEQQKGAVGKIIAKIRDFIDRLAEMLGKHPSARSLVRKIESGKIFERPGVDGQVRKSKFSAQGGEKRPFYDLDALTRQATAFRAWDELVNREDDYFPTFHMDQEVPRLLADLYDEEMARKGDPRRAHRVPWPEEEWESGWKPAPSADPDEKVWQLVAPVGVVTITKKDANRFVVGWEGEREFARTESLIDAVNAAQEAVDLSTALSAVTPKDQGKPRDAGELPEEVVTDALRELGEAPNRLEAERRDVNEIRSQPAYAELMRQSRWEMPGTTADGERYWTLQRRHRTVQVIELAGGQYGVYWYPELRPASLSFRRVITGSRYATLEEAKAAAEFQLDYTNWHHPASAVGSRWSQGGWVDDGLGHEEVDDVTEKAIQFVQQRLPKQAQKLTNWWQAAAKDDQIFKFGPAIRKEKKIGQLVEKMSQGQLKVLESPKKGNNLQAAIADARGRFTEVYGEDEVPDMFGVKIAAGAFVAEFSSDTLSGDMLRWASDDDAEAIFHGVDQPNAEDILGVLGSDTRSAPETGSIALASSDPGVTGFMYLHHMDTKTPYAMMLRAPKGLGALGYQIFMTWCHNNGKVLHPDSSITRINQLRRTEQMISSALRFGTTKHLMPHKDQGVPWTPGKHQRNIAHLIVRARDLVKGQMPEMDKIRYDFGQGKFLDEQGQEFTGFRQMITDAGQRARELGIGVTTLQRAIVTNSFFQDVATANRAVQEFKAGTRERVGSGLQLYSTRTGQDLKATLQGVKDKIKDVDRHGLLGQILTSPEWDPTPAGRVLVRAATDDREERKHQIFNQVLDQNGAVSGILSELKNEGLSWLDRLQGIDPFGRDDAKLGKDYKDVRDALVFMDTSGTTWEKYQKRFKGSDRARQAITAYRDMMDRAMDLMRANVKEVIDAYEAAGRPVPVLATAEDGKRYDLWDAYKEMGSLKGSYMPRIREQGDFSVLSLGPDRTPYRWGAAGRVAARRLATRLQNEGHSDIRIEKNKQLPEAIYQDISIGSVSQALEQAIGNMKDVDPEIQAKFRLDLLESTADLLKARAMRAHRIARSATLVKGYLTDPLVTAMLYAHRISGGVAKGEAATKMIDAVNGAAREYERQGDEWVLTDPGGRILDRKPVTKAQEGQEKARFKYGGVDPTLEPERHRQYTEYITEQLRNPDRWDRAIGLGKALIGFKFLGLNPKSAVVNATAMVTTAPPAIHQYVMNGQGNFAQIGRALARASVDFARVMRGATLDGDDQKFVQELLDKGWDQPQLTRDAMRQIRSGYGRAWEQVMNKSMWMFGATEKWNRGATMLASYRLARQMGAGHKDASEKAREASNRAHGVYGRGSLPSWAQGTGVAAKVFQLGYTYQKFSHNWLQMMGDLIHKGNYQAVAFSLASTAILGGTASSFGYAVLMTLATVILRAFGDDRDPAKMVADVIRDWLGEEGERAWRFGAVGVLPGVDLSGSLGIGMPELLGPFGGAAEDLEWSWRHLTTGQPLRAMEGLLPAAVARIPRTLREMREGVTTRKGFRVWTPEGEPYRPGPLEATGGLLGFRGSERSRLAEREWEGRQEVARFAARRDKLYERFRAYLSDPDAAEYQEIMRRVAEYNDLVRSANREHLVPLITRQSLAGQTRRMAKPNKRALERIK